MNLGAVDRPVGDLHLNEVANATRFAVVDGARRAQTAEDGEGGGQVLEGVRLRAAADDVEELAEDDHGGVGLAAAVAAAEDDRLRVAGLPLLADGLVDDAKKRRVLLLGMIST